MNKIYIHSFYRKLSKAILSAASIVVLFTNCDQRPQLVLDNRYNKVKTIESLAACAGPNGSYQTTVHSAPGYMFFRQDYLYNGGSFSSVIINNAAFVLDSTNLILDSMSIEQNVVVASHDFHRIAIDPHAYFTDIVFKRKESEILDFNGSDILGNNVILSYDEEHQKITGFVILNPTDTTEQITVSYEDWEETEYGPLANSLIIDQGQHSQFTFRFQEIKINDESFEFKRPRKDKL